MSATKSYKLWMRPQATEQPDNECRTSITVGSPLAFAAALTICSAWSFDREYALVCRHDGGRTIDSFKFVVFVDKSESRYTDGELNHYAQAA